MVNEPQKVVFPKIEENYPAKSDVIAYLSLIKKVNSFEHEGVKIFYSDDVWDFSKINSTGKGNEEYKISFKYTPKSHVIDLKDFAILYLKFAGKISSTRKRVSAVNGLFVWMDAHVIYSLDLLTQSDINEYFDEQDWKNSTYTVHRISLKLFFLYQELFFGCRIYDDIEDCFESDTKYDKAAMMENRFPDIPNDYFDGFLSACIKLMNDKSLNLWLRGTACIIVVLSQTGLRISEVLSLEVGCIETIYDRLQRKKLAYLTYSTWKRVRKTNTMQNAKTFVNELTCIAVDTLTSIYSADRKNTDVNYLYLCGYQTIKRNHYPVTSSSFSDTYKRFGMVVSDIFNIVDVQNKEWERVLSIHKINDHKLIQKQYPGSHTIILPKLHQFRVHLCTELYNKGVSLEYIESFMGHLSPAMESYYIRPKDTVQEDMAFSQKIIKSIVIGDTRILGDTQGLTEKIQEFISKGNYNIATDLNSIVSQLAKKIPIRQKTGGVCIKSSLRECSSDAMTNEFYCSYSVCPNIFHFFYMLDVSFKQCQELEETIAYNSANGFVKQAEKETNMFKLVYNKKILPEFNELKAMIKKKGKDYIKQEFTETAYFIDNMIEVERIMDKWKTLYCKE